MGQINVRDKKLLLIQHVTFLNFIPGNMFFMFGGSGTTQIEVLHLNYDNSFNITQYDSLTNYYNYPFAFKVTAEDYLN